MPGCADTLHPLNGLLSSSKESVKMVQWNDNALAVLSAIEEALASATLLSYPELDAPTCKYHYRCL